MTWTVTSDRLPWPRGEAVAAKHLVGCNIDALVAAGHLAPVTNSRPAAAPQEDDK